MGASSVTGKFLSLWLATGLVVTSVWYEHKVLQSKFGIHAGKLKPCTHSPVFIWSTQAALMRAWVCTKTPILLIFFPQDRARDGLEPVPELA